MQKETLIVSVLNVDVITVIETVHKWEILGLEKCYICWSITYVAVLERSPTFTS